MPTPALWEEASHGVDAQEFSNPAYGVTGPTCPHSAKSVSLDTGVGLNDGAREASGAAVGMTEPNPTAPVGYPLDLSPLLEVILQMRDS